MKIEFLIINVGKPIKPANTVGTVIYAIFRSDTAVVGHLVDPLVTVVCG